MRPWLPLLFLAGCSSGPGTNNGADGGPTSGNCPAPPAGASAAAQAALAAVNAARTAAHSPCATLVPALDTSTERHCAYYAANSGSCVANPHAEVSGCAMFVAANFGQRMSLAGYSGSPAFEDMAFGTTGAASVQIWIDSVWHRTPLLSPWVLDLGYGEATGCATADFGVGAGAATPAGTIVTWPYDGQTGVPPSFAGNEGPPPPGTFPSGYPITIFAKGASITSHTLTVDGQSANIDHIFIAPGDAAAMGLLSNDYVMYAKTPLAAATHYRVTVGGSISLSFAFTTR